MSKKITALRFQKRNKDRVNVYLDGEFALGVAAIVAAPLRVGQTLSDVEIEALRRHDGVERSYEKALNFLSYRPRSTEEVRRNLRKKQVDAEVIEAVIERLLRAGLLDDGEFARYWVDNRVKFNPRGARALRHELWSKGVSDRIIDETLEDFTEESAARQVAQAGIRRYKHLDRETCRRRLSAYMARRGFSYAVIKPLVHEMLDQITFSEEVNNE
jgi:regulatory protein